MVNGANGAKSKIIAILDYSDGSDMIIGKPGVESIKDLKGQKVGLKFRSSSTSGVEALKQNGMTQSMSRSLTRPRMRLPGPASGKVAAVGAWYPVSSQVLTQVPGQKNCSRAPRRRALFMTPAVIP